MNQRLLCVVVFCLLTAVQFNCDLVYLPNYTISLYSESLKLSTMLLIRPAYCLYEQWQSKALDLSVADKKTSTIQVQITDGNNSFVVPQNFEVPQCRLQINEQQASDPVVYEIGPDIKLANVKSTQRIIPNQLYRVRFVLINKANNQIAITNWSEPFETNDLPPRSQDINAWLKGRSGGMVVITVLLSIGMFILLVGLAIVLGVKQH
ncbi:hypothetical protein GDO86_012496 [Hymenochirus boettgeri]|uniref:Uroplakin-2 n=1 Tax=Hymenochirus boettgeri TaxID=247094 RepID=A0A8T2ISW6_9PIPI|nr:hypothetical protein GDO86_012496 [Hymenochirus boettgeri]